MLSIGLMSGTSMDGIDAALLNTDGIDQVEELAFVSMRYDSAFKHLLKAAEQTTRNVDGDLVQAKLLYPRVLKEYLGHELQFSAADIVAELHKLSVYLYGNNATRSDICFEDVIQHSTELHATLVKKLLHENHYQAAHIDVVGYHGQTLLHAPDSGITIQIGDGQRLADELGITVVNDFRHNDVSHGGQGAPFAPIYHYALAKRDHKIPVIVVNCGGIANMTVIPTNNPADLCAFDSGPGNGLLDRFIRMRTHGLEHMDKDGLYGQQGKTDRVLLDLLFEKAIVKETKNFFTLLPPKSLDYGDMTFIPELHDNNLSLNDICRTLEVLTAESIVRSLELIPGEIPRSWILAGGGWNNPVILNELIQRLRDKLGNDVKVQMAEEAGWNGQALEAQIFAYLAVRTLKGLPISFPGTTGVSKPSCGGRVHEGRVGGYC